MLIKANPHFFRINTLKYQEIDYFKKKSLKDIFNDEDKEKYKDFKLIKSRMVKSAKRPMQA